MTGSLDWDIALATFSILKHHKSSIEPPPLAKIIKSKLPISFAAFIASTILFSASLP